MEAGPRKRKVREDKKPACDACRAHKIRCDASLDYSRPCSRCRKKQIKCVVQDERRMKKESTGESLNEGPMPSPHDILPRPVLPTDSDSNTTMIAPAAESSGESMIAIADTRDGEPLSHSTATTQKIDATKPQTLGRIQVKANTIDACFARFDCYYAPLIPLLSGKLNPNQIYRESPLKFWVIVTIGSRKSPEYLTLFSSLSPHVEALAMTSLCLDRSSPYPVIEAHLLMCSWHLSTDRPFWRSIYCTLSSAVVTLTLQAGMHHCLSLQGVFASAANSDVHRGAKLWAYAVVLNQSTMTIHGYPINDMLASRHLVYGHNCCDSLPPWLLLQCRTVAIVTKVYRMVSDLELESGLKSHSKTLKSLVMASEAELSELHSSIRPGSEGPLTKSEIAIARLQVRSFLFLTSQSDLNLVDRNQLSNAAIATVDAVNELKSTFQISLACPDYVFHGVLLAACTLLKLLKSYPPDQIICEKDQTSALFDAINICKSISVVNNDIPAKVSEILTHLWSSPNVYRDVNDDYITSLQVQNRLTMSVVFDCLWWWRRLFMSTSNQQPYRNQGEYKTRNSLNYCIANAKQDQDGSHASLLIQYPEYTVDFSQLSFDDWDSWGLDWDNSGPLNIQASTQD